MCVCGWVGGCGCGCGFPGKAPTVSVMLSMGAKTPKMPVSPELGYLLRWFSREDPETESDMQPSDSRGKGEERCQAGWGGGLVLGRLSWAQPTLERSPVLGRKAGPLDHSLALKLVWVPLRRVHVQSGLKAEACPGGVGSWWPSAGRAPGNRASCHFQTGIRAVHRSACYMP